MTVGLHLLLLNKWQLEWGVGKGKLREGGGFYKVK